MIYTYQSLETWRATNRTLNEVWAVRKTSTGNELESTSVLVFLSVQSSHEPASHPWPLHLTSLHAGRHTLDHVRHSIGFEAPHMDVKHIIPLHITLQMSHRSVDRLQSLVDGVMQ